MRKELQEKRDPENSTTHEDNMLAISNSWLPLLSTSRINMHFPQTFDLGMCCWANNLRHYRHQLFPVYFQSCSTLFLKDLFYRPGFEEGINANWTRQKLNTFISIWKIALAIFTEKEMMVSVCQKVCHSYGHYQTMSANSINKNANSSYLLFLVSQGSTRISERRKQMRRWKQLKSNLEAAKSSRGSIDITLEGLKNIFML